MNLQGFDKFKRENPMSDKINALSFNHLEFFCGDATTASKRFIGSMGVELAAKSDLSTGNDLFSSYVMQTGTARLVFTAAYHAVDHPAKEHVPFPGYSAKKAAAFTTKHGLAVYAIGIDVEDVPKTFETMVTNGGIPVLEPVVVKDTNPEKGSAVMAEISLYGDVVIRLIDAREYKGNFLPNYEDVVPRGTKLGKYGIDRVDHIVGNVHSLQSTLTYIKNMTGFHEFAEFTAEDVGTVDSGLNSCVLANNNEMILLPVNEPTFGTKRKSQIQTYLEQNEGEGVQHIAFFSNHIFNTLDLMRQATTWGGFELMPGQGPDYYQRVRERVGVGADGLSEEQYKLAEDMGVLIDKDDQGILLQIFTKPIGDRPTIFFEIIQRVGCMNELAVQKPGCGGFGKGNFRDLFKSIEQYENDLNIN